MSGSVYEGMTPFERERWLNTLTQLSTTDGQTLNEILDDPARLIRRIVNYAHSHQKRKRMPAWKIVSDITYHGSGMSSALATIFAPDKESR